MKRCPACNRLETDDALTFCRADGTPLVREANEDAGTIRLGASHGGVGEARTPARGAPHNDGETQPAQNGGTTLLDSRPTSGHTRELKGPNSRRGVAAVAAVLLVVVVAAAGAYFYASRGAGASAINSVAVLPFVNASGDQNAEYLSDGVAESLMNSLSQLPDLKVAARNSAFRYKGKDQDAQAVGKELGVRAVLTGSVKEIGDQILISVSLDDARDGHHIWGDQYARRFADIIEVQRDIARQVTDNLRLRLTGAQQEQITKRYTANPEAYRLYLQGRFFLNKHTTESTRKAVDYFKQAIARDQSYALAYAGLSDAYDQLAGAPDAPPAELYPQARAAVSRALEIDSSLAEAHMSLANVKANYERDFAGAEAEFKRAVELNPNDALSYFEYG
ncbi:MAG: hypothetical protein M3268_08325, partial [Acidobacteriota bacterium]|nr:hypothetical protein [Acidobacteriota bacterium]